MKAEQNQSRVKWTVYGAIALALIGVGAYLYSDDRNALALEKPNVATGVAPSTADKKNDPISNMSPAVSTAGVTQPEPDADFTQAVACTSAFRKKDSIDSQLKVCEQNEQHRGDPAHAEFFKSCDVRIKTFSEQLSGIANTIKNCSAKDSRESELALYQQARREAALGNLDAQICYVRGTFFIGRAWTDQEVQAYKTEASTYVTSLMKRGDWRVVEILRSATPEVVSQSGLLKEITSGDKTTIYRMNRLLRKGSVGEQYSQLLDAVVDYPQFPTAGDTKAKSDAWIEKMYRENFSKAARIQAQPDTCVLDN
jgi:hypothetical protein